MRIPITFSDLTETFDARVQDGGKAMDMEMVGYTPISPVKGKDYWTSEDKAELIKDFSDTITEEWIFTLDDGTVVKKKVAIG